MLSSFKMSMGMHKKTITLMFKVANINNIKKWEIKKKKMRQQYLLCQ